MNDKVEEIYEQMFSPEPIPDCVRTMFETVNRYASRIDAGMMRPVDLAIIAAMGLSGSMPATVALSYPPQEHEGLIDTVEGDEESPVPSPTRFAGPQTPAGDTSEATPPSHGPTGPMDAPARPSEKRKGLSGYAMQRMTLSELRAHSKEFYGFHPPLKMGKIKLIKALKEKQPL